MNSYTELPRQQHTAQKKLISSFKTLKPLAVLIIILLIVLVSSTGGYLLGIRANQNASQDTQRISFQISPTITAHSPSSIESTEAMATPTSAFSTSDMKVYRNERLGFEIKHSDFYQIVKETSDSVFFGEKAVNGFIIYLIISTNQTTDYKSYKFCEYGNEAYKQTFPCLENGERWGQKGDIVETKLGDISAESFYIAEGLPDATYHIVQTKGSPKIEAKMFVSGGGLDSSFKRILSTFRALDNM